MSISLKFSLLASVLAVGAAALTVSGTVVAQPSIMVSGDSISAGWREPSYRKPLLDSLAGYGCDVEMVGDQTLNDFDYRAAEGTTGTHREGFEPGNGYDVDHQAFPAITTDEYADGVSSAHYTVDPIHMYVSAEQPDYVLIHLGTNDMGRQFRSSLSSDAEINQWADVTLGEMRDVIDGVITGHNNASSLRILVANFIPYARDTISATQMVVAARASDLYTKRLESMVLDLADPRILIVDVESNFNPDTMTSDGIHPNSVGEEHLAGAFLPVLRGAGLCPNTPSLNIPAAGESVNGTNAVLQWDDNGLDVTSWRVRVGDTQSGSSNTYFDSGNLPSGTTSISVSGLPANQSNVFVSLQYASSDGIDVVLSNFISLPASGGGSAPAMTYPLAGTVLPGSAVNFSWQSNGTKMQDWWVRIGSTVGGTEYFDSGRLDDASTRAVSVSGLPTDGSIVYLELNWKTLAGPWNKHDLIYLAANGQAPGKELEYNSWYQIGLPFNPGAENTLAEVFGDMLPVEDYFDTWAVFEHKLHPTNQDRDETVRVELDDEIVVGKGYWIIQLIEPTLTLNVPPGAQLNLSNASGDELDACTNLAMCYAIDIDLSVADETGRFRMMSYPLIGTATPNEIRVTVDNDVGCVDRTSCTLDEAYAADVMFEQFFEWNPGASSYDRIGPDNGVLSPWSGFWAALITEAQPQNSALVMSSPP